MDLGTERLSFGLNLITGVRKKDAMGRVKGIQIRIQRAAAGFENEEEGPSAKMQLPLQTSKGLQLKGNKKMKT